MNSIDSYDYVHTTDPISTLEGFEPSIAEISRLDRAILEAQVSHSLAAEATAHERAAQFYLAWGKEKIAVVYLQDAYDCYARSGSKLKTESLEQQYPQFLASILRQRQQRLGGLNYFTDEFIATLSHEFRTPLNSILGMSETLLEEVFGSMNEKQLNAATTIDRGGWYLLALINNMVDLQRMHQVLINLLNQAIDSTPIGGRVKLVVTREQENSEVNANSSIQFSAIDTIKETSTNPNHKAAQSVLPINSRRIVSALICLS
jgi:signal transduction histidine kinase